MEYYTAREAMTRLGISASTFHRLVSEGKIARLTPPGSRRSLFRKEDVENLAEMLEHEQQARFSTSSLRKRLRLLPGGVSKEDVENLAEMLEHEQQARFS